MPYKTFINWIFDGKENTEIPTFGEGIILTSYKSPINNLFLLKVFMRNKNLNYFLDKYMNNMSLFYIDKEEFFKFMKNMVIKFRVKRNEITYFLTDKKKSNLKIFIEDKFPLLNREELDILINKMLSESSETEIYKSLGLKQNYSKRKIPKSKSKKIHKKTILKMDNNVDNEKKKKEPLYKFLKENFEIMDWREMDKKIEMEDDIPF